MPPRDEREFESRRQQIIEGALHVFARKGFERATNKEIADAAGIGSPGLIYHYFKDKADLFRQVIEERSPSLQLLIRSDTLMDAPPHETLTLFGNAFLETLASDTNVALFKLLLGEAFRRPTIAGLLNSIGPARGFAFLNKYLQRQMDTGVLRRTDPGAAVRCFLGPLILYILSREVFPQSDAQTLSPETMVATAVEIFLRGMELPTAGEDSQQEEESRTLTP